MCWRIRIGRCRPEIRVPPHEEAEQLAKLIEPPLKRTPGASLEWLSRHLVHHKDRTYLVIPNLYSCDPGKEGEVAKALAMNQIAGVLSDLELVRWPKRGRWWFFEMGEIERLKGEEEFESDTDLSQIRKDWLKNHPKEASDKSEEDSVFERAQPIRNHGLFSKAERALASVGWSERACRDIEIFPLTGADALALILTALEEPIGIDRSA